MADKQKVDIKEVDEKDRLKPIFFESEGKKYRLTVEKVGYVWEMNGNQGVAERLRLGLAKFDPHGDVDSRSKRQLNIPLPSQETLKKLFDAILSVKDKPLK